MRVRIALVVAVAATCLSIGPADALDVHVEACVEFNTYTFSPPLTTTVQGGTASFTYTNTCAHEFVSSAPPQQSTTFPVGSGGYSMPYFGSCALALLQGGTVHALIGGTVLVSLNVGTAPVDVSRKVEVLVPDKPCTDPAGESSASGAGPAFTVFAGP